MRSTGACLQLALLVLLVLGVQSPVRAITLTSSCQVSAAQAALGTCHLKTTATAANATGIEQEGVAEAGQGAVASQAGPSPNVLKAQPASGAEGVKTPAEQVKDLLAWLRSNGALIGNIQITDFRNREPLYNVGICQEDQPGCYRGIVALDDLEPGEVLVSVPLNATILEEDDNSTSWLPSPFTDSDSDDRMAAALLLAKVQGKQSTFWPYVQALPQNPTLPLLFSDEEAAELQNPKLWALRERMGNIIKGDHELLKNGTIPELRNASLEDCLWAHAMMGSRAFGERNSNEEGIQVLAPLIDMVNHSPLRNADWALDWKARQFLVLATRDVAQGEEVFVSYSNRDLEAWMTQYGFVPEDDPSDSFDLFDSVEDAASWHVTKFGIGQKANRSKVKGPIVEDILSEAAALAGQAFWHYSNISGNSEDSGGFGLRQASLDDRLLVLLGELWSNDTKYSFGCDSGGGYCTMHSEVHAHAAEAIAQRCEEMLRHFPTSIEQDEALLGSPTLSRNTRAAIWYRLARKRVLQGLAVSARNTYEGEAGPDSVIYMWPSVDSEAIRAGSSEMNELGGDGYVEFEAGSCWYAFLLRR